MKGLVRFVPVALFVALVGALVWRLTHPADTTIHSHLANRPLPAFTLVPAVPGKPGLASAELARGRPHLVNLFASWCVPCIAEAPLLVGLRDEGVAIVGIAVRDSPAPLTDFLARNGDPFMAIGNDGNSAAQLALGSSGVPETFVVDGRGIIRRQFIGGLSADNVGEVRAALAEAAR